MKKLILILLVFLSQKAYCVLDTLWVNSKITDVTVFFNGAQISRQVDLKSLKGKHFLVVDNLPGEINPVSIQVNKIPNSVILSVKHENIIPNLSRKDKVEVDIQAKIDEQEFNIKTTKNKMVVFGQEETLLINNQFLKKGDAGSSISDIKEAADYYRLRLNDIKQGELNLSKDLEAANKKIQELYLQMNEFVSKKNKTHSRIIIAIDCDKDVNESFVLSYFINSAGWTPLYDFRVDDITQPLSIVYNANIYQSSGENWNQAKLKLSTSNPTLSGNIPDLAAWKLGNVNRYQTVPVAKGSGTLKGRILDKESNEPIPFANVVIYSGTTQLTGVTSDFDGNYTIKPIASGYYDIKVSYIGYTLVTVNSVRIQPDMITFQDINMRAASINLESVEIADYKEPLISVDGTTKYTISGREISKIGGKDKKLSAYDPYEKNVADIDVIQGGVSANYGDVTGGQYSLNTRYLAIDKDKGVETSNYISNSLKTNVTNLEYTIDIPYTIPSD